MFVDCVNVLGIFHLRSFSRINSVKEKLKAVVFHFRFSLIQSVSIPYTYDLCLLMSMQCNTLHCRLRKTGKCCNSVLFYIQIILYFASGTTYSIK